MNYNIIKKALFALVFILLQNGLYAQQLQQVKRITVECRDSTWYKEQKELWKKEVLKNKKDESAWLNYFMATRYYLMETNQSLETRDDKTKVLLNEMEKALPKSFMYNLCKGWHIGAYSPTASSQYIEEAYRLRPEDPLLHYALIGQYEVYGTPTKRKEMCQEYFNNNAASPGFLNYNYNVLASLEKNAILFTVGDNDSYPVWVLQDVFGFRTDVLLLNIHLCAIDSYRETKLKGAGINLSKELLDSLHVGVDPKGNYDVVRRKKMEKNIVRVLAENSDRPVYAGLTAGGSDVMKAVENNLYLVGLASRYSKERIDNIALLKKNYEQSFLLDYLQIDFRTDESAELVKWCNQNYVTPFVSLYKHYTIAGETQKAEKIKKKLEKIAKESNREKEILDLIK